VISREVGRDRATEFIGKIINASDLEPGSPILEFREWLSKRSELKGTVEACTVLARVIQTFNACNNKTRLATSWLYDREPFPIVE
jgi:hypothetical protein